MALESLYSVMRSLNHRALFAFFVKFENLFSGQCRPLAKLNASILGTPDPVHLALGANFCFKLAEREKFWADLRFIRILGNEKYCRRLY